MDGPLILMRRVDCGGLIRMSCSGNLGHHRNFVRECLANRMFQSTLVNSGFIVGTGGDLEDGLHLRKVGERVRSSKHFHDETA